MHFAQSVLLAAGIQLFRRVPAIAGAVCDKRSGLLSALRCENELQVLMDCLER